MSLPTMPPELDAWQAFGTRVDDLLSSTLGGSDAALDRCLEHSAREGLPAISVSLQQGRFLGLLASAIGAKRILEIGTLGGYSTIFLARALPSGPLARVVSLELHPHHARVARENLEFAKLGDRVEVVVGPAIDSFGALATGHDPAAPFDFVFIDADKENITRYFDLAVPLTRPGAIVIVDNIVRDGGVVDADSTDPRVQGVRRFLEQMKSETRVQAAGVQTLGSKGYDGFAIARVLNPKG
ncbi:MAG: O-methyltransferase [Phycisphaerales bacterium]